MQIICYGDSNTLGYDPRGYFGGRYDDPWPELLGRLTGFDVRSDGSCGRTIPNRETEFPQNADLLIIMLGTNDLLQGDTAERAGERMAEFLSGLDPERVLLLAPPPMVRGAWVPDDALVMESRNLFREYRKSGVRVIDTGEFGLPMAYDGVHLTQEGHQMLANALKNLIYAYPIANG